MGKKPVVKTGALVKASAAAVSDEVSFTVPGTLSTSGGHQQAWLWASVRPLTPELCSAPMRPQVLAKVAKVRDEGNKAFTKRDYLAASKFFDEASKLLPETAGEKVDLLCNKAACFYQLKRWVGTPGSDRGGRRSLRCTHSGQGGWDADTARSLLRPALAQSLHAGVWQRRQCTTPHPATTPTGSRTPPRSAPTRCSWRRPTPRRCSGARAPWSSRGSTSRRCRTSRRSTGARPPPPSQRTPSAACATPSPAAAPPASAARCRRRPRPAPRPPPRSAPPPRPPRRSSSSS
jgi:hypothetical protein